MDEEIDMSNLSKDSLEIELFKKAREKNIIIYEV